MEQKYTNKLINQKSPYLLQHAHNPVDWYPWGEEAFNKAKSEQKPVFLSIGYSTCHWCHVMERESFEDEEVAKLLNDHYVAIKVDREERPDIDSIYMAVCQALTGQGGWPLTIVMTPTQKPFFAGTYFPKKRRMGMPGLTEILTELHRLWTTEKDKVMASGEEIAGVVGRSYFQHEAGELTEEVMHKAYEYYERSFDPDFGGFGTAPKFPTAHNLSFLLRYWKMTGEKKALDMVETTLEGMYGGGMYDHVGFGFSRYSTDRRFLVPHFEKMLYDNALLAIAYMEACQATGKPFYAQVAREIFTYVLRDMTSPEGAFYSAEDADSEGEEGKFYLWTPGEVKELLGPERGKEFCRVYDITDNGNFEGASIPNLIASGLTEGWDKERHSLFLKRESRVHPFKDDKVLTAWNGLMIAALSFGARVLQDKSYAEAAEKAVEFILTNLRRKDGRLLARYRKGEAAYLAYLDDYAFLVWGLTELYQATFKARYLDLALEFNDAMVSFFWDEQNGGLFQYAVDAEALISRPKEIYDGAIPSGNSVAALNLLRLARFTEDESLKEIARRQIEAFGGSVAQTPPGHAFFLMAYFFDIFPTTEVTVIGDLKEAGTNELLAIINKYFKPELLLSLKAPGASNRLEELVPSVTGRKSIGGKPTVYICQNFACQPPVTDPVVLDSMLASPNKIGKFS